MRSSGFSSRWKPRSRPKIPSWSTRRGTNVRRVHRRRAALPGVGFFAGLGLLIAGISINPFLSVLGFVIMVAAAVTAIYSWQHVGGNADAVTAGIERRPRKDA